jgi:hypothetical protein
MSRTRSEGARLIAAAILALMLGLAASPVAEAESTVPGVHTGQTPIELQVARLYLATLDREPDAPGLTYWYRHLSTGADLAVVADGFATSKEFELRFGVEPGADGDLKFVRQVYDNVLDRLPDPEGEQYWLGVLEQGLPRAQVVLWFSESVEFINRTGLGPADLPEFAGQIEVVTASDLGVSWRAGCPSTPDELRVLTLSFVDFAGDAQTGELVVHADDAEAVLQVFRRLYESRYPIQSMRTIDEFGASDDASMDANNTSAFNCRRAVGSGSWSRHAYGQAIDINPLVNPYVKGSEVLPPSGDQFTDRQDIHNPAIIRDGDIVVKSFDEIGWFWGGRWTSLKDYQHFSNNNR